MGTWHHSVVLLCAAADQADSNAIGEALGYGPDTFSLPAGPEGGPVSHYFNHSFAADEFLEMVTAMGHRASRRKACRKNCCQP